MFRDREDTDILSVASLSGMRSSGTSVMAFFFFKAIFWSFLEDLSDACLDGEEVGLVADESSLSPFTSFDESETSGGSFELIVSCSLFNFTSRSLNKVVVG